MRYFYGMSARPFGIGTFPDTERLGYTELDKNGFQGGFGHKLFCIVETVEELSEDQVYDYELIPMTEQEAFETAQGALDV